MIDVVADASVVLKWFHAEGEEEVPESRQLIELHRNRVISVSVIDLTAYEIGNALLRGRPQVAAERVAIVINALSEICPRVTLTAAELAEAVGLAEQHGLSVYDAAYAAAARTMGGHLATLDRELLRAGLGQRPSALLAALSLFVSGDTPMTWNDDDLSAEFGRYEARAIANGMTGNSLQTYVDRVGRFLRWRIGDYRPRGVTSNGRPVPSIAVTASELRTQAATFVKTLHAAGLEQPTIDTYERHALFFIRWLEGDFDPGSTR